MPIESLSFTSIQSGIWSNSGRNAKYSFRSHEKPVTRWYTTPLALYKVYRTYHRLIGAPALSPPLHVRVHAVYDIIGEDKTKITTCAHSYDIIPCNATSGKTFSRLLRGQCVPAEIRARRVIWPLRGTTAFCIYCGVGIADQATIQRHLDSYTGCSCRSEERAHSVGLSLRAYNCWNFADSLISVMLAK